MSFDEQEESGVSSVLRSRFGPGQTNHSHLLVGFQVVRLFVEQRHPELLGKEYHSVQLRSKTRAILTDALG